MLQTKNADTMSTTISPKTKNHVAPVAEIIDQPALKRGKTDDFADMVTEHAPSLSDNDLQPLKAIYNAKARRKKYIRGRAANNVQWVYEKTLAIDPEGTNSYISQRDEASGVIEAVLDSIVQQVASVAPQSTVYGGKQPKDRERAREYLKMLLDCERLDELWGIWQQLQAKQSDRVFGVKQNWPVPCTEHAESVYFAAKGLTNYGMTFTVGDDNGPAPAPQPCEIAAQGG